ncbi:MAG TPA: hypothetical protein DEF39_10870 [Hungateiclostridium thermocellum]|jgi:hypothetical protein|uniref:Uncharacterized protein n=2 Tax=Acetivibrio thermocellus TaxID=1515 RepID=A3DJM8_ACET2|nr:hypothetical protein [Acetivibrio thermocellus]ABN54157.1 hypothetical protein Cthe_2960 [Acetivibrio thermocellus ATCC 27405]ADU73594.1 hypothetical protein Clo1313_0509 [Acetivibrio thermocellus DSM 1313]ALX07520.1 hypothetical protein AD2_00516 [Acetivibrio thermocellus AD2]ANV75261.1 hypothetical protein LQRI_0516 [Acetivibrio thermocellus DSM 2360]EIC03458.1 hypothetical protein YSBL_2874 [Acetivibrio thermocellus YS]
MKKEELQWDFIKKAKAVLMNWSEANNIHLFAVHFIPLSDFSLEVYVFYESDIDITQYQQNGVSDKIKQVFLEALNDLNYMKIFNNNITFTFDSNENVINNYQGSYFFRLR